MFSKFWRGATNLYEAVRDSRIFWENVFCPQNRENGPKIGQEQGFLNLLKIWSLIFTEFVL